MVSRSILEGMSRNDKRLFTIPLSLDELVELHIAARAFNHRNATSYAFNLIMGQIHQAKEKFPGRFTTEKIEEERARILARSKNRAKATRKRFAKIDKAARIANSETSSRETKNTGQGGSPK